jgi:hypothetical protein
MLLERWDAKLAVTGVALVLAVGEPRRKFSQVALLDWLTAQRTERLRAGCPAIHQDEFQGDSPVADFGPSRSIPAHGCNFRDINHNYSIVA